MSSQRIAAAVHHDVTRSTTSDIIDTRNDSDCSVCQNRIPDRSMVCCGQTLHKECLRLWFETSYPFHACPYCRNPNPWLPYVRRQDQATAPRHTARQQQSRRPLSDITVFQQTRRTRDSRVADRNARVQLITERNQPATRRTPAALIRRPVSQSHSVSSASSSTSRLDTGPLRSRSTLPLRASPADSLSQPRAAASPNASNQARHDQPPAWRRRNRVPSWAVFLRITVGAGLELALHHLAPPGYRLGQFLERFEGNGSARALGWR